MNETDTYCKDVVPKLQTAGWDTAPYSLDEQRTFTNPKGRVRIVCGKIVREKPKRADYILRYRNDFSIAVVETKANYKTRGVVARRERIRPEMLLGLEMPLPTIEKQTEAVKVLTQLRTRHELSGKSTKAESALLDQIFNG